VGGLKDETLTLATDCRKLLAARLGGVDESTIDVYTPETGAMVDASVDTNAWTIKLTDALVKRLRWQNVKGLGIVTLTGRVEPSEQGLDQPPEDDASNKKQKLLKGEAEETPTREALDKAAEHADVPILDVLPFSMASATRSVAQPLHVGDLRLADLRKIMQSSGHTAEFRGEGTLLIDGSVVVRKSGTGRIEVESINIDAAGGAGAMQHGSTFYDVKNKIYEGLAIVAGG